MALPLTALQARVAASCLAPTACAGEPADSGDGAPVQGLLEQPNGLARRILAKAGSNPTELLEKTDDFIRRQPRVTGDSQQARLLAMSTWMHCSRLPCWASSIRLLHSMCHCAFLAETALAQ